MSFKAYIFDLDGVITDTAKYHYQAWKSIADELQIPFDEATNESLKGLERMASLEALLSLGQVNLSFEKKQVLAEIKNQRYIEMIGDVQQKDVLPGVLSLLLHLKEKQKRLGVASASKNAEKVLTKLGLTDFFDYIADANQIKNAKPHPEIFLTVAKALSVTPSRCVGIEDAALGIQAINQAGMYSVGIGDKEILREADVVYSSLQKCESAYFVTGITQTVIKA